MSHALLLELELYLILNIPRTLHSKVRSPPFSPKP